MPKPSFRNKIIEAGLTVMFRKGYNGSGVRDIVAQAAVPQGSFTNHFRSKELFALEVLNYYYDYTKIIVQEILTDTTLSPRQRLERYLDHITTRLKHDNFLRGCLIGDFSLEKAHQSELLRNRLQEIFVDWRESFARCIKEAQDAGEIDSVFSSKELAAFLLASWEGAILLMKVEKDPSPLYRFKKIVFQTIFKKVEKSKKKGGI